MFYLKELFLIAKEHKALALTNFVLLMMALTSAQMGGEIRRFFSLEAKSSIYPYFNALVESRTNSDYIARKMSGLPGVAGVEFKDSLRLKNEMQEFLGDLKVSSLLPSNYKTFKINLEKEVQPESRRLIKEYFSRLIGTKEVTFSEIKSPTPLVQKKDSLYTFFSKNADLYFLALLGGAWLFTLWLLSHPVLAQTYLIEKFQRKEKTALKIYSCLCLLGGAGAMSLSFFLNSLEPVQALWALPLMGLGALFFIRKSAGPRRFI